MKINKILLTLCLISSGSFCFAASEPLFEPQKIDFLWYTWAGYEGQNTEISCDFWDGSSWTKQYQLTDISTNNFTPAIALDNNKNPWVAWVTWDGMKTSIYSRYYDGKSWSKTTQVDDVDIYSDNNPSIVVDQNNVPWVTWSGSDGTDDDIYISHFDGKNWSNPVIVNTDNTTPDITPIIAVDNQNKLIIVWCGFELDRYKLFFSQKLDNKWTEQKPILKNKDGFSVNLPNILKKDNGKLELLWYEKNLCYKSLWDGLNWSDSANGEILLPKNFFKSETVGPAYVSWIQDGVFQSLKVISPPKQKLITACATHISKGRLAWFSEFLCSMANAEVEANKYIAFGDSITWGVGATDISPFNPYGYPPRLEEKLNADIAPSLVVNEGKPGEYTPGGLSRIDDVLNRNNSKFILVMEGTNDVTAQYSTETIIFDLGQMCQHAIDFGTTPLLATLTPRMDFLNNRIKDDINPAITALAQEKSITLVDQYTEMAKNTALYMSDGRLHPNDLGYKLMADTWFDAIDNILNPKKEEEDDKNTFGCGSILPNNRDKGNNSFYNFLPLSLLFILILIFKKRLASVLQLIHQQ